MAGARPTTSTARYNMADTANDSSSVANEGSPSPSAPIITVVSEPDEEPKEDTSSQQEGKSSGNRAEGFSFRCSPASSSLFGSPGSSNFKQQFTFGSKMSGLKPATPFGSSTLRSSFLRPSQLASPDKFGSAPVFGENSLNKSSFPLKPSLLGGPFALGKKSEEKQEETPESAGPGASATGSLSLSPTAPTSSSSEPKPSEPSTLASSPSSALPKFVPLGTPPPSQPRVNPAPPPPAATAAAAAGFVFGQNLHARVSEAAAETTAEKQDEGEVVNHGASCSSTAVASNGTTENLFTSVLKKEQPEKSSDSGVEGNKSLMEAAREYEEARANKRKYEEVAVVTGEEDEVNILQINCKLFAFDKVKLSWAERGRGNLRLNDKDLGSGQKQSRVIMRATGSLRVVLNTKLWPGMVVEKVSSKSVRLTAMDAISGEILVFLVMASPKDADYLYNYMESRVTALKASCAENVASHSDMSHDSSINTSSNSCDESESEQAKRMAVEPSDGDSHTNHISPHSNSNSQDSGGSDEATIGKNPDGDVTSKAPATS